MFKCSKCKLLEKEVDYLKALVDRLLVMKGGQPVTPSDVPFDVDKILEREPTKKGVEQYGD